MLHRRFISKRAFFAALLACLLLTPMAWGEAVYTWVDADGVRHFSQQPPEDQEYELKNVEVRLPTTPAPAAGTAAGAEDQSSLDQRVDDYLVERDAAQQKRRLSQAEKAAMQQNCQVAQQNLVTVESRTRVMVPGPDGEMRQLTDDERLAAVSQAQQDVQKFCQD